MATKKKQGTSKIGITAASLAATAVAAGAYYFYYSKSAKKNRAVAKEWMKKAEKEIVSETKKLKEAALNKENYNKIVTAVSDKYQKLKKLESGELKDFAGALKSAWTQVEKDVKTKGNVVKKAVMKAVKDAVKK